MATNADDNTSKQAADDSETAIEDDLKKIKEESEVESSEQETDDTQDSDDNQEESDDTGEDDSQEEESEEDEETDSDEDAPEFVKEFPNIKGDTPEEYAKNLEIAYQNSTAEAIRLKKATEDSAAKTDDSDVDDDDISDSDPLSLYMKQKMDEEIDKAYADFSAKYAQVRDPAEYEKFLNEVSVLSQTILTSQKRLATPQELYSKAAVLLGWDPTDSKPTNEEKVGAALKDTAASTKTNSSTKPKTKSKVSDDEVRLAKELWGAGKSDADIRKELEAVKK